MVYKSFEKDGKLNLPVTAVWQDCEFCVKFMFTFRKKFYLNRKNSVTKLTTSSSTKALPYNLETEYNQQKYDSKRNF